MSKRSHEDDLITNVEREAGLAPGLLVQVLALEADYPDLDARGERRRLQRDLSDLLDQAADRLQRS